MTHEPKAITSFDIDINKFKPGSPDEAVKRALFYCHAIDNMCNKQLQHLVNECLAGTFGDELRLICEPGISDLRFGSAKKLLTCVSLHMAGLDHSGENAPSWLMEMFFESLKESDELFPLPTVQDIIARHGSWKEERMIGGVADEVVENLGFPPGRSAAAQDTLCAFLRKSRPYRTELLVLALTQPLEALRHHLQLFQ